MATHQMTRCHAPMKVKQIHSVRKETTSHFCSVPCQHLRVCASASVSTSDYWSESDQDEVDGSMTLKQEGPSSLCDTYHRTPSVSTHTHSAFSLPCFTLIEYFIPKNPTFFRASQTIALFINKTSECSESIQLPPRPSLLCSAVRCFLQPGL